MIPNIYVDQNKKYSIDFCEAFAAGCGGDVLKEYIGGSWAGYGSPKLWENMILSINAGHDFYYGDHAYFGRGKYWRVTKNAFQHNGIGEPDYDRLKVFYDKAAPWQKTGKNILICTQTKEYYERNGIKNWLSDTILEIKKFTKKPIVIRQKGVKMPLIQDLKNAFCVVVCTSNVAVEAIMNGVPVFATHQCAASVMGLNRLDLINNPYYPDNRMKWAATLAANQWTLEEIASGQCWEKIK